MADAPVENIINESASLETEHPPLPASLDDIQALKYTPDPVFKLFVIVWQI